MTTHNRTHAARTNENRNLVRLRLGLGLNGYSGYRNYRGYGGYRNYRVYRNYHGYHNYRGYRNYRGYTQTRTRTRTSTKCKRERDQERKPEYKQKRRRKLKPKLKPSHDKQREQNYKQKHKAKRKLKHKINHFFPNKQHFSNKTTTTIIATLLNVIATLLERYCDEHNLNSCTRHTHQVETSVIVSSPTQSSLLTPSAAPKYSHPRVPAVRRAPQA